MSSMLECRRLDRRMLAVCSFVLIATMLLFIFMGNENWDKEEMDWGRKQCWRREFGQDSFVCVCTSDYCDSVEPVGQIDDGLLVYYVTSREKHRLSRFSIKNHHLDDDVDPDQQIIEFEVRIDASQRYQRILGYFDPKNGIAYTMGRVPMGASDFSVRAYTYLDSPDDFELRTFALAAEDLEFKIPNILAANKYTNGSLKLIGTPWSAPGWMKTNGQFQGGGKLNESLDGLYYRTYAMYFKRFLDEYSARGVPMWGVTPQNEPELALIEMVKMMPSMDMSDRIQKNFVNKWLSPVLKQFGYDNLKILAGEHDMRSRVPDAARELFSSSANESEDFIDGIAFHWYFHAPFSALDEAHHIRPDKLLLSTEASSGIMTGPLPGNWTRGWLYGWDILNSLKHWSAGWIDWNLCLDENGGPSWLETILDAPILINANRDEFYKQTMFYFIAHFSRFIPSDSIRIHSTLLDSKGNQLDDQFRATNGTFPFCTNLNTFADPPNADFRNNATLFSPEPPPAGQLEHVAFLTPSGETVLILINQNSKRAKVRLREGNGEWEVPVEAESIQTVLWKRGKEEAENYDRNRRDGRTL